MCSAGAAMPFHRRGARIEGPQSRPGRDLTAIQPDIEAQDSGNAVRVDWDWRGFSAQLDTEK
jgi:hypothetical protein